MAGRRIDWEAVARDYAVSDAPATEIARKHGLAAKSIYARAKREGWARSGPAGSTKVKKPVPRTPARKTRQPAYAPEEDVNSGRALSRMMNIVNRLADELERHIDLPDEQVMSATEKKGAADILTSLARALEKLTVLEREARAYAGSPPTEVGSGGEVIAGAEEGWDELQRRLDRLAAGKTAE